MFGSVEQSKKIPLFYKMPTGPGHYFGRLGAGRLYGQKFLIAFLMEVSKLWFPKHARHPFGIGDMAAEDGSSLPDHISHSTGAAVDLFIIHKGGVKRNDKTNVITHEHEDYDREKTIDLATIIAHKARQYRLIQFLYNDPDVIDTIQCVPPIKTFPGHDEHIHLLFNGIHSHTDEELDRILGIKSFSERLQAYLEALLSSVHMLLYGSNGPPVQALQAILNTHGSSNFPLLAEDGVFGSKTKARVQEFQLKSGLTADGVVGPKTKQALSDSVANMQAKR